jgi:purine-binding chemotaxis protein CheW
MVASDGRMDVGAGGGQSGDAGARAGRGGAQVKHVCFRMHGQDFAVDIAAVRETLAVRPITRVFLTPPCFAGIINLRGDVVPVLDVALLLGLPPVVTRHETRIVLCQHRATPGEAGELMTAGILVDELTELRVLDMGALEPPPATLPRDTAALLAGVVMIDGRTPLQVLDIARLFTSDQVRVFQREAS